MHQRTLLTIAAFGALGTASAVAVPTAPAFVPTPFTTGAPSGGAVSVQLNWQAANFGSVVSPLDHYDILATSLSAGPAVTAAAARADVKAALRLLNGQRYRIQLTACTKVGLCSSPLGSRDFAEASVETLIDATAPTGTLAIAGGAAATNSQEVSLNLTASDPLVDGRAGSASGVQQVAIDEDGDGSFPCQTAAVGDQTGCARSYQPVMMTTLPPGDGLKTVGVQFGDAARLLAAPCVSSSCFGLGAEPLLGNVSGVLTANIVLDTAKPVARLTQAATEITLGGTVAFDAAASTETNPAIGSGLDAAAIRWDWKDGTRPATGAKVKHAYVRPGIFFGELTVADRAGNRSNPRSFLVSVAERGQAASGTASLTGVKVSPTSTFRLSSLKIDARYRASRLAGALAITGSARRAGAVRATLTPAVGRRTSITSSIGVGRFSKRLTFPPTLAPGRYRLAIVGPGGTISSKLRIAGPREGFVSSSRLARSNRTVAKFRFASLPAPELRSRMSVTWWRNNRFMQTDKVRAGASIDARSPGWFDATSSGLRAELKVGGSVIAVAR